jgi:NADPH:quinone reductase-like Zn-dependent oxidoreductase
LKTTLPNINGYGITMKVIGIKGGKGSSDSLFVEDVPTPKAGQGQVLIKIKCFGVNRMDISQREGKYPLPPQAGPVMGVEYSGVVVEESEEFKKGDEVFGLVYGGAYAEYVVANTKMVIHKPKSLSFEDAAGIPEVWFTALQALFFFCGFVSNNTSFFHAGASG